MRIDKSMALYHKETANSVKLTVPHIGLCPSHEDFERIALKILRRRDLEDIDLETYNNHLEIITLVPRRFAESTANVGDLITHIYASGLAWIETAVVWLLQGNTTMPTGDKALEVVKVRKFWDETLKHTSIYVTPRNTDVMDDAADSDDKGRGRGLKTDDFGADQDANRSNTVNTIYGAAPYQTRGDSRQRKGKGNQSAMQGDQHAGRGSSCGGGCTGKHAAKGAGNNGRSTGKAGRGVIREEANTANPDMPSAYSCLPGMIAGAGLWCAQRCTCLLLAVYLCKPSCLHGGPSQNTCIIACTICSINSFLYHAH
ncbi:TPA: hypothetical protein ACH3X2_000314 [Trebouxia sp. C0005]